MSRLHDDRLICPLCLTSYSPAFRGGTRIGSRCGDNSGPHTFPCEGRLMWWEDFERAEWFDHDETRLTRPLHADEGWRR